MQAHATGLQAQQGPTAETAAPLSGKTRHQNADLAVHQKPTHTAT